MNNCLARERWGGTLGLDAYDTITLDMKRLIQSWRIRQTIDQAATVDDDVGRLRFERLLRDYRLWRLFASREKCARGEPNKPQ